MVLPDRGRSHSYDESFLHRDPGSTLRVLEHPVRASEEPVSLYRYQEDHGKVRMPPPRFAASRQQPEEFLEEPTSGEPGKIRSRRLGSIGGPRPESYSAFEQPTRSIQTRLSAFSNDPSGNIRQMEGHNRIYSGVPQDIGQPCQSSHRQRTKSQQKDHLESVAHHSSLRSNYTSRRFPAEHPKHSYPSDPGEEMIGRYSIRRPRVSPPVLTLQYPVSNLGESDVSFSAAEDSRRTDHQSMSSFETEEDSYMNGFDQRIYDEGNMNAQRREQPPQLANIRSRSTEMMQHSQRPRPSELQRRIMQQQRQQRQTPPTNDEDSLFDFGDGRRERPRSVEIADERKRGSSAVVDVSVATDDDTSVVPRRDAERLHVHLSADGSKPAPQAVDDPVQPRSSSPIPMSEPQAKPSPAVSFGKDNRIQYYTPDPDETLETSTLGGRSMNSWYTKSAESEVEDIIKDIFLIGNAADSRPGRRKVKNSPRFKQGTIPEPIVDDEETTLETFGEDSQPESSQIEHRSAPRETERIDTKSELEDPLSNVWNFFFGTPPDEAATTKGAESVLPGAHTRHMRSVGTVTPDDKNPLICNTNESSDPATGVQELLQMASGLILGPEPGSDPGPVAISDSKQNLPPECRASPIDIGCRALTPQNEAPISKGGTAFSAVTRAPSLEEDTRLVELASQAAKSMHRIKGYEFDETYSINFPRDIKFSVVDLKMPLGLIFHENDVGCWVTKVLESGSAWATGNVEIGDQLAAIDGFSAINMKVNEIASIIREKNGAVELTFLRYMGPMHPTIGEITEEGYEVRGPKAPASTGRRPHRRPMLLQRSKPKEQVPCQTGNQPIPATTENRESPSSRGRRRFRIFGRKKGG